MNGNFRKVYSNDQEMQRMQDNVDMMFEYFKSYFLKYEDALPSSETPIFINSNRGISVKKIGLSNIETPAPLSKSANYTITDSDIFNQMLVTTGSSANVTITLPLAKNNPNKIIEIVKDDTGTKFVEIARGGSDTVRGSATSIYAIEQGESIRLLSDGVSNWKLLGNPERTVMAQISQIGTQGINYQSGTWLSVSDGGVGITNLTFITGSFLSKPLCVANTAGTAYSCSASVSSATAGVATSFNSTTGLATDQNINLICIGPK